jgi:DNA-binding CsgD family transcriptional regulator
MVLYRLSHILIVLGVILGIGALVQVASLTKLDTLPFIILIAVVYILAITPIFWRQLPRQWENIIWLLAGGILIYLVYLSRFSIGTYLLPSAILILLGGLIALFRKAPPLRNNQMEPVIDPSSRVNVHDIHEEFRQRLSHLTRRETQILKLIEDGKTNLEISKELVVSTNTVRYHVHEILKKLDCTSRSEAALKIKNINSK